MARPMRRTPLWVFAAIVLLIPGCAGLRNSVGLEKFDQRVHGFVRAVRWGQFEEAKAYLSPGAEAPAPAVLKGVKVSDSSIGAAELSGDGHRITCPVTFRYYRTGTMVERTETLDQVWQYDPDAGTWFLEKGFPTFSPAFSPAG